MQKYFPLYLFLTLKSICLSFGEGHVQLQRQQLFSGQQQLKNIFLLFIFEASVMKGVKHLSHSISVTYLH
jgi:hypothetical protein